MQWSVNLIRQPYKIVKLICLRATVCLQYNLFIHSSKKSSTLECNFIVYTHSGKTSIDYKHHRPVNLTIYLVKVKHLTK